MDEAMFALAARAMDKAHAPYSRFHVGAVVKGANGKLYSGCNVENASYPEGWCAETTAIAHMVMDGETRIAEIVVMGRGDALVTPCGGCRQRIREFAGPEVPIHICSPDGLRETVTLGALLPLSFGPENLQ
ncbi:MAG: cytidine deaminase [Alphaproteobacteria bacterium]|nr:cytidine deaminase [Alphaproteobacteria bacterium]